MKQSRTNFVLLPGYGISFVTFKRVEKDTNANLNEAILQIRMGECSWADTRPPYTEVDGDDDDQVPMEVEDVSEQLTISS